MSAGKRLAEQAIVVRVVHVTMNHVTQDASSFQRINIPDLQHYLSFLIPEVDDELLRISTD